MIQPMTPNRVRWSGRRRPVLTALIVAGVLAVTTIAVVYRSGDAKGSDSLSAAETAQRTAAFTGSLALPLVAVTERDAAIDTMALPLEDQKSLKAFVEVGRTDLAWLSLWDDQAADGDRVRITANGFVLDLELHKAPHRIGIPVAGVGILTVTGLHDGGGGITLGLQTTDGPMLTPVIQPGQVLSFKLR